MTTLKYAVAAAVFTSAAFLTPAADAAFPGGNGRVAVEARGTIFTVSAAGTARQNLGAGQGPTYSPDGGRLAFFLSGDIWVMNANGTGRHPVTSGSPKDVNPAWSPDGSRIVFSRAATASPTARSLAVVSLASGTVTPLTTADDGCAFDPNWAARGGYVVYLDHCAGGPGSSYAIRKVQVATGRVSTIVPPAGVVVGGVRDRYYSGPADVTPDGTGVVWFGTDPTSSDMLVTQTRLDGSGSRVAEVLSVDTAAGGPAVSPDGRTVIFGYGVENSQISSTCLRPGCPAFYYDIPDDSQWADRLDWQPVR